MSSESKSDKQITIDVPADRVAEFYAFYGRFLAGRRRRRRHAHGRRCAAHRAEHAAQAGEPRDEPVVA